VILAEFLVEERFDTVIIGGGPGGATAATLLATAGWSVALVERKAFPRRKVCGEYLSATNLAVLNKLGLTNDFLTMAGPPVRRVGLFAGERMLSAPLPRLSNGTAGWGRALGRESLDALIVNRARVAGADVRQPCAIRDVGRDGDDYISQLDNGSRSLRSRVVIAAHGYWEPGPLPSQPRAEAVRADDLLAFKAHFTNAGLPNDLMPLLAFPGGYGGMVHTDGGRVSISCCVRRDRLAALRADGGTDAGEAVEAHLRNSCRGVREALDNAGRDGPWLAAGPLRPGIRVRADGGMFLVGNAAGEAHPVVAEGISMAMQSAALLSRRLIAHGPGHRDWHSVGRDYARAWRAAFAPRLRAAAAFAHWAMRPAVVAGTMPLLRAFPGILGWGARLSGKVTRVEQ
jgi:flavin-dependent dehydrogenase